MSRDSVRTAQLTGQLSAAETRLAALTEQLTTLRRAIERESATVTSLRAALLRLPLDRTLQVRRSAADDV